MRRLARYGRYGDMMIPGTNIGVNIPGLTGPGTPPPLAEPLLQPLNLVLAAVGAGLLFKGVKALGQAAIGAAVLDVVARQVSPQYATWRAGLLSPPPPGGSGRGLQINIPGLSTAPPGVTFAPSGYPNSQTINGWRR